MLCYVRILFIALLFHRALFYISAKATSLQSQDEQMEKTKTQLFYNPTGGFCHASSLPAAFAATESLAMVCYPVKDLLTTKQQKFLKDLGTLARDGSLNKVVRKEIRQLTLYERKKFKHAMNQLRINQVDGVSEFDIFVSLHRRGAGPSGTRIGPATWGWHREYVLRFETALRRYDSSVSMPYWDVTLESHLPNSCQNIVYGDDLFGDATGVLQSGMYSFWKLNSYCAIANTSELVERRYVSRKCTKFQDSHNDTFSDADIKYMMSINNFTELIAAICIVCDHDVLHALLGGTQSAVVEEPACAVADPISWSLHAYVDYLWAEWRYSRGNPDLLSEYPATNLTCHQPQYTLYPFQPMTVADATGNSYDELYTYKRSPFDCSVDADCNSEFLFCLNGIRCSSKILDYGECSLLPDKSCMSGNCEFITNRKKANSFGVFELSLCKPRRGWDDKLLADSVANAL